MMHMLMDEGIYGWGLIEEEVMRGGAHAHAHAHGHTHAHVKVVPRAAATGVFIHYLIFLGRDGQNQAQCRIY